MIFSAGIVRNVGRNAHRFASAGENRIQFMELNAEGRHKFVVDQIFPLKQHDLPGAGQSREVSLFKIAVGGPALIRVKPASAVPARRRVFHPPHERVTEILRQMLVLICLHARLRAGVNGIENILFLFRPISRIGERFPPVGEFDDHFHLRIHRFCRTDDEILRYIHHEIPAVFLPGPAALPADAVLAGAVGEVIVIQNDLVENGRRELRHLPDFLAHGLVGIAVGTEQTLALLIAVPRDVVRDRCESARHLDAVLLQQSLPQHHLISGCPCISAVRLKINLVKPDILFQKGQITLDLLLRAPRRNCCRDVRDHLKIAILCHMSLQSFCLPYVYFA